MTFCVLGIDKLALGLKDSDIFQIQMVWYDPNKEDKKK